MKAKRSKLPLHQQLSEHESNLQTALIEYQKFLSQLSKSKNAKVKKASKRLEKVVFDVAWNSLDIEDPLLDLHDVLKFDVYRNREKV